MAHSLHDDRFLWLGFGLICLLAAKGIRLAIKDLIHLTKLDPNGFPPKRDIPDGERPEDTISVKDLQLLAESPNSHIARTATSLLVSRVKRSSAVTASIRADLRSKDQDIRRRATTAMDFMGQDPEPMFQPDRPRLPYDDFGRSPAPSPLPVPVLGDGEFDRGVARLGAGSRLRDGTFGQSDTEAVFRELMRESNAENSLHENPWANHFPGDVVPSIEDPVAGWTDVPREMPMSPPAMRDSTDAAGADEVARRRRRREAMVLHEGEGGVSEGDIIRPMGR